MKKKLIALLCVSAMLISVLSGCGNKAEEPSAESAVAEEQVSESQEEAGLEYVELDWYVSTNATDTDLIQAALDEYFLEKLNCKVNVHFTSKAEYGELMSTKLMSGEDLDIVNLFAETPYSTYAEMGALYPIDTLWDEYGTNVKGLFSEGVWDSLLINDHIYAVPTLKDNAYIIGYIYNDTLASELGLDMENLGWTSFMDMEEDMMKALALRDEKFPEYKGTPLIADVKRDCPHYFAMERFISGSGLSICNVPGKEVSSQYGTDTVFNFYETDEFREMCLMKQRLVDAGVMAYDYTTFERDVKFEPSTLMSVAWGYTWIDEHIFSEDFSSKLVVFDGTWTDAGNYTTAANAIGANCKDPERAMMVLDLLNSDPYVATLLRFGVEGEHWEKDANGDMQLCNRNADPSNAGWIDWYGVSYGNLTIVEGPESYTGPDGIMLEKMAEYNNNAILAAHMGFTLDTSNIANEISACSNIVSEYQYLMNGQLESQDAVNKTVDEFIAKLQDNGSAKIVEETQAQLDAWIASK